MLKAKSQKRKGGFGFLHIVQERVWKDGESSENAIDVAIRVAEAVQFGSETEQRSNTRHIDLDKFRAVVAIADDGSKVITGYEIVGADENQAAKHPSQSSQPNLLGREEEVVAALGKRLSKIVEARKENFEAGTGEREKRLSRVRGGEGERFSLAPRNRVGVTVMTNGQVLTRDVDYSAAKSGVGSRGNGNFCFAGTGEKAVFYSR